MPNLINPFPLPTWILSTYPIEANESSYYLHILLTNFLIKVSISLHKPMGNLKHPIVKVGMTWITNFIITLQPAYDNNFSSQPVRWSLHKYKCLWSVRVRARVQVSRRELHTHIHLWPVWMEGGRRGSGGE